jgi:phenylacetate-CoA ligase
VSWLQNNIVLPLFERDRHWGLGRRLREFARFDKLPEARQREYQAAQIKRLLTHAYESVPLYREAFEKAGAHPRDWEMGRPIPLPLTSRETVREDAQRMISNKFPPEQLRKAITGGTTSTPVILQRDVEGQRDKLAMQYHLNRWFGFDQGDKMMAVWGAQRDLELNPSWRWRIYEERILRQIPAPAGQIGDEVFERFLQRLNSYKPKVLFGYSVAMTRFAEYVAAKKAPHHEPKLAIVTAEPATEADKRSIAAAFGCEVTEQYGSREVGMVASECKRHDGLHFYPAGCFPEFEFLAMSPDGPMYRLIITDLLNYGMPLIRYDTGDCVLLHEGQCACGSWYPRVKAILGRVLDTLILADGSEIPGQAVACHMVGLTHNYRSITQVQVIQKAIDLICVKYVSRGGPDETNSELTRVSDGLSKVFPEPVRLDLVRVDDIPRAPSGKMRLCIREMEHPSVKRTATSGSA